ncbi:MAG: hypothetical protein ACRELB_19735 [Polyangiaceae bacterium]
MSGGDLRLLQDVLLDFEARLVRAKTGDEKFDVHYVVSADTREEAEAAVRALSPEIRAMLFFPVVYGVKIDPGLVSCRWNGTGTAPPSVERLRALVSLAAALEAIG